MISHETEVVRSYWNCSHSDESCQAAPTVRTRVTPGNGMVRTCRCWHNSAYQKSPWFRAFNFWVVELARLVSEAGSSMMFESGRRISAGRQDAPYVSISLFASWNRALPETSRFRTFHSSYFAPTLPRCVTAERIVTSQGDTTSKLERMRRQTWSRRCDRCLQHFIDVQHP